MRKLFTLLLMFGATFAFGQYNPKYIAHPTYTNHKFYNPPVNLSRATSTCDSFDMMDYCSYNEVLALQQGQSPSAYYGFNTAVNPLYIQELTSFVTDASGNSGYATYIGAAFDTLAFQDYSSQALYSYPLDSATITLEGIQFFYAYNADTLTQDHKIENDSLVFTVYAINNAAGAGVVDTNPILTYVWGGDSLSQLYTGQNIGIGSVPANVALSQGQGFFVKMQYLNKDTSTHFDACFTFLDSCGEVTYQGQQYLLADLAPLTSNVSYLTAANVGLSFMGVIFPGTGSGAATVENWDNLYGLNNASIPASCSLIPNQNWAILPIIDVCQGYAAQATATPASTCPNSTVTLGGSVTGSSSTTTLVTPNTLTQNGQPIQNNLHVGNANNNNLIYSWTASSGTLTGSTTGSPTLTMPATGNDTVTVVINDGTSDATATVVVYSNPVTLTITNTPQPVQLACGGNVTINTNISPSNNGHNYQWRDAAGLDTTGTGVSRIKVTSPGTYYVTVTNNSGCTSSDSVVVQYSNGATNTVSFSEPDTICQGFNEVFSNTSSNIDGWSASWTFGDGGTSDSLYTSTYNYTSSGTWPVSLTMDSAGCVFTSPSKGIVVRPAQSAVCKALGINDVSFNDYVSVVPNPSNGYVNIAATGVQNNISIIVYNILGSEVSNFQSNDAPALFTKSFDFSNFADGAYLIKIQSGDKVAVKRLIISK